MAIRARVIIVGLILAAGAAPAAADRWELGVFSGAAISNVKSPSSGLPASVCPPHALMLCVAGEPDTLGSSLLLGLSAGYRPFRSAAFTLSVGIAPFHEQTVAYPVDAMFTWELADGRTGPFVGLGGGRTYYSGDGYLEDGRWTVNPAVGVRFAVSQSGSVRIAVIDRIAPNSDRETTHDLHIEIGIVNLIR
jgi:hypothetical protein